jgi:hypothetical protein
LADDWEIESDFMNPDCDVSDRLLSAIHAFGEELLLWIDTELDRLREPEQAENARIDDGLIVPNGSQFRVSPPLDIQQAPTDPERPAPVVNPRQRLDALARILDDRLKQAQAGAGIRMCAGSERNSALEDETPERSRREGRE